MTKNRISKAILQSGVKINSNILATPSMEEAFRYGERVTELAGVKNLEELRNIPAESLLQAKAQFDMENMLALSRNGNEGAGWLMLVPNVDGHLLSGAVQDVFKAGKIKNIPYMAGCVMDDLGTTDSDRKAHVPGILLEECKTFCSETSAMSGEDAYCYLFARELPAENGLSDIAFHSSELWYTFGTLERCWRPMQKHDYTLSRDMVNAWTSFMKTGHPGNDWKACTKKDPYVKVFS